jgi:NAD(P)-dependent dehydrogenase (short-subunit alcohol dehydrogenase family)
MSETRLAGKRMIVTGAGQGLGRAFALHLAGLGARVLATDIRADRLALTRDHADERGVEVHITATDVSDPEHTRALAATAREVLGGLDGLVNNAAIVEGLTRRPFDEIDDVEWDRVLEVNAKGTWLCAKATVPLMREAGGGSIVNPTPLGRLGAPEDLLGALAFLMSDESAFITGQTVLINGGRLSH